MNMNSDHNLTSGTENFQGNEYGVPFEVHHKNGQLEKKGFFLDGIVNGPYVAYYPNGQLEEKCVFNKGELNGPYISYFSNGQLEKKCVFKQGLLDSQYEEYDRRGNLLSKGFYRNNRFMSEEEMAARQKTNTRLQQLDEILPPSLARRLSKRTEVVNFRSLYPKSRER